VVVRQQARGKEARRAIILLFQQRRRAQPGAKPPTIREIAAAVGLSVGATHRHVRILREAGLID
jgi:DNA-binding Lrp family transcriptional regulator